MRSSAWRRVASWCLLAPELIASSAGPRSPQSVSLNYEPVDQKAISVEAVMPLAKKWL